MQGIEELRAMKADFISLSMRFQSPVLKGEASCGKI
jgi:hypothetical protein